MLVSSLRKAELLSGLSAFVKTKERSRLILIVEKCIRIERCSCSDLLESKVAINILINGDFADGV